jgi:shikimate dehydrogenase
MVSPHINKLIKMQDYKAELIGVFGHPVAENPTVVMHEAAFAEMGLNWRYLTIEVFPEDLENAIKGIRAFNMKGINLTIPHKVNVLKYLDEIKPDAAMMGAVNTVINTNNWLVGENTDGKGFMYALTHDAEVDPSGKSVVILGAGGAARSISVELALAGVKTIAVVSRSAERGEMLTSLITAKTSTEAHFVKWESGYVIPSDTDILINATSIGLFPNIHDKPDILYDSVIGKMVVCDVIPSPMTDFLRESQRRGAQILDGLGMLVYQGAIGFKLWTGKDAPLDIMHKALSKAFNTT